MRSPEDKSSPESDFDKYSNWVTSTSTSSTSSSCNNNKRRRSSSSSSSVVSLLVDELRDLKNLAKDITNEQQKIRKEVNLLATRQTQHSIQLKDFDTQIAQFSEQMSVKQPNSQQHLDNLLYKFPAEHQRPKFQQHEQQQQQQQSIVPQNQYLVHSLFTQQQQQPQQQDDLHRLLNNNNNAPHNKLHENQIVARRRAAKFLPFLSAYNLENYAVPFVLDGPNNNKPFFAVRKVGNLSYRTQLWDAFKTRPVFSFVSPAFSCLVKRSTVSRRIPSILLLVLYSLLACLLLFLSALCCESLSLSLSLSYFTLWFRKRLRAHTLAICYKAYGQTTISLLSRRSLPPGLWANHTYILSLSHTHIHNHSHIHTHAYHLLLLCLWLLILALLLLAAAAFLG